MQRLHRQKSQLRASNRNAQHRLRFACALEHVHIRAVWFVFVHIYLHAMIDSIG